MRRQQAEKRQTQTAATNTGSQKTAAEFLADVINNPLVDVNRRKWVFRCD